MRSAVIAIAAIVGFVVTMAAQAPTARVLSGTILGDASNSVLAGVELTLAGVEPRKATSDENGNFSFGELPLGEYELRAVRDGFATVIKSVTLAELAKDSTLPVLIRMRLGRSAGQVTGSVRDRAGVPLAGVSVAIASPDLAEKYRSTTTGSDGRYRFSELPDGTYDVMFSAERFVTQQHTNAAVLTNGSTASVDSTMAVGGNPCEELQPEFCKR